MKILVTGASGFVGRAIVAEALQSNFEVFRLEGPNKKARINEEKKDDESVIRADISDYSSLLDAVKIENIENIDVIIHSAGLAHQFGEQIKDDFWRVNVRGAENVARLAASFSAKRFILISSVSVYGDAESGHRRKNENGIDETAECHPRNFYAQSKLESEKAVVRVCAEKKIALTVLRLATVIGEGDKGNVARLISLIDKNRFVWLGRGENRKSLIYKGDAARACLLVAGDSDESPGGAEIYNVTGEASRMSEIVADISLTLGKKIPKIKISPKILNTIFFMNSNFFRLKKVSRLAATVNKWLAEDIFSGRKFERAYNFRAQTPLGEAVRRQVENYKKQKKLKEI